MRQRTVTISNTASLQVESMHVRLYRQLQVTHDERAQLTAHWNTARQHTIALDAPFHSSMRLLQRLLRSEDLPAAFVAHVSGVAAGTHAASFRESGMPPCAHCGACDDSYSCFHKGDGNRSNAPDRIRRDVCQESATDSMHANKIEGQGYPMHDGYGDSAQLEGWFARLARSDVVFPMLGASAQASATAAEGFVGLVRVHKMQGRIRGELTELQLEPGVLLGPLKMARVMGAHVVAGGPPLDVMQLCQLAVAQQRWRDAHAPLEEVLRPLPACEWLQGAAVT